MQNPKSKRPISPSSALITSAELCAITGLTERRHQQLAATGMFPPPVNGSYELQPTIKALIGYYRESATKSKAGLAAKQELLLDKKIERAEFDLSVSRNEFKPTAEIAKMTMAIGEELKSALQFHLIDQAPALNAGLDALTQRTNNKVILLSICKRMQSWAVSVAGPVESKEKATGQ